MGFDGPEQLIAAATRSLRADIDAARAWRDAVHVDPNTVIWNARLSGLSRPPSSPAREAARCLLAGRVKAALLLTQGAEDPESLLVRARSMHILGRSDLDPLWQALERARRCVDRDRSRRLFLRVLAQAFDASVHTTSPVPLELEIGESPEEVARSCLCLALMRSHEWRRARRIAATLPLDAANYQAFRHLVDAACLHREGDDPTASLDAAGLSARDSSPLAQARVPSLVSSAFSFLGDRERASHWLASTRNAPVPGYVIEASIDVASRRHALSRDRGVLCVP